MTFSEHDLEIKILKDRIMQLENELNIHKEWMAKGMLKSDIQCEKEKKKMLSDLIKNIKNDKSIRWTYDNGEVYVSKHMRITSIERIIREMK